MVYILFITLTIFLFSFLKDNEESKFAYFYIFFAIVWILIIGGQDSVGTDYPSYYNIFSYPGLFTVEPKKEYIFYWVINWSEIVFKNPQATFFVIAFLCVLSLGIALKKSLSVDKRWIYLFLIIAFATTFNNQMNAVRQYFSAYLLLLGLVYFIRKKFFFAFLFFLIARGIHEYAGWAIVCYLFIYFLTNYVHEKKALVIVLLTGSVVPLFKGLINSVSKLMLLTSNTHYVDHEYFQTLSWQDYILKYFYLFFYLFALRRFSSMQLTHSDRVFFSVGIFSYSVRMMTLISSITNRFGMFFELIMIYPLVYYFAHLNKKNKPLFFLVFAIFFFIYSMKVTYFAKGEYLYKSIF